MAVPGKGPTTKLFGEEGGKNILNQLNKPKVIVMTNHTVYLYDLGEVHTFCLFSCPGSCHWAFSSENEKLLVQQEIYLSNINGWHIFQAL